MFEHCERWLQDEARRIDDDVSRLRTSEPAVGTPRGEIDAGVRFDWRFERRLDGATNGADDGASHRVASLLDRKCDERPSEARMPLLVANEPRKHASDDGVVARVPLRGCEGDTEGLADASLFCREH